MRIKEQKTLRALLWAVSSICICLVGVDSSSSATNVAQGKPCVFKNQRIKYLRTSFVCTLSSKKLIWVKVSDEKKPNSKPVPNEKFSAWSLEIDQKSLVNQAYSDFKSWTENSHGNQVSYNYLIDPKLERVNVDWIRKSIDAATRIFGSYSPTELTSIIGSDCAWINAHSPARCIGSNGNQYFSDSNSKAFFVLSNVSEPTLLRPSDLQTPGHEFFHLVQAKLAGSSNWTSRVPSWFGEGSAYFVGISISEMSGTSKYMEGRDEELLKRGYESKPHLELSDYVNQNFSEQDPYGIGCVATEYIVASVGMEKLLDIFRFMGNGLDFDKSFEKATGMPLVDFYKKFELIRDKTGLPHGI